MSGGWSENLCLLLISQSFTETHIWMLNMIMCLRVVDPKGLFPMWGLSCERSLVRLQPPCWPSFPLSESTHWSSNQSHHNTRFHVDWCPLPLTFLIPTQPWIIFHQLSLHLHLSMKHSSKRTNQCEVWFSEDPGAPMFLPLHVSCYLSTLHNGSDWKVSVFKFFSSLSPGNQTTYLNIFFFYQDDPSQHV